MNKRQSQWGQKQNAEHEFGSHHDSSEKHHTGLHNGGIDFSARGARRMTMNLDALFKSSTGNAVARFEPVKE